MPKKKTKKKKPYTYRKYAFSQAAKNKLVKAFNRGFDRGAIKTFSYKRRGITKSGSKIWEFIITTRDSSVKKKRKRKRKSKFDLIMGIKRTRTLWEKGKNKMPRSKKIKRTVRASRKITYHGRKGKPVIHLTKNLLKPFIMVRKKGGGTKRLYLGSLKASREITTGFKSLLNNATRLIIRVGKVQFKKKK